MTARHTASAGAETWREHQRLTPPVELQARRLLDEAGSPGRARHAVDAAAKSQPLAASAHDQFARQLGFASYLSLFEASTPIQPAAGKQWFVTALRSDLWVVWNDSDLVALGTYPTRDAAERAVPPATGDGSG